MNKRSSSLLLIIVFTFINSVAFAWYRTPEAGRSFYWGFSADLLSRGVGVGGTIMPSGIAINPAGNAFAQRLKFEVGYGVAPALWAGNYDFPDASSDVNVYNQTHALKNGGDFFMPSYGNFGFLISTKYGNFTGYSTYMNFGNLAYGANNDDLAVGKIGTIYFGFSKDYNDHFAFGVSGNIKIAYNENSKYSNYKFDVAGAFDFGFIFKPDWVAYFNKKKAPHWGVQDFQFSIALKEIGKPLINMAEGPNKDNDLYWFGDPFTHYGGMSFNLYNDGATYWKWLFDVGFPFFQNFKTSIGTEVQIYKFLILRTAYTFDLEGVLEYAGVVPLYEYMYSLANVNFGISLRFTSDFFKKQTKEEAYANRHKSTEFSIDFGGKPYHDGFMFQLGCTITIGTKDETPPEIKYVQQDYFISPNFDGVQDNLNVDLSIIDDRYIMYWKFEVYDQDGRTVRTIESKEQRAETMKFTDVVKKYFSPKTGIPVPKTIVWDGKDDAGQIVPDGKYTYKFFAMDDNKNMDPNGTQAGEIIIKTDKPLMESAVENVIFSPNDDGQKDTLIINLDIIRSNVEPTFIPINEVELKNVEPIAQTYVEAEVKDVTVDWTAKKQLWYVDIIDNNDKIVRTFELDKKGKVRLEWDGRDNNGNPCADGVYKVKLHSVDLAGNYWENFITNIIINTEATPIELKIKQKYFSPNGNKTNDTIGFVVNIPNQNGIDKWTFEIKNHAGQVVRHYSASGIPPTSMEWDGMTDKGNLAAEGEYYGYLVVTYVNGNTPNSTSPKFELDITKPSATVTINPKNFSPDGDGKKDTVEITQKTSYEDQWNAKITNSNGEVVKTYSWKGEPPKKFTWDGLDDNNNLLPDGNYNYTVASIDLAGNDFESTPIGIQIFTKETPVFITALVSHFSPKTSSPKSVETFQIRNTTSENNKVTSWKIQIKDDKDSLVFAESGTTDLPTQYQWNGTNSSGNVALDGDYYALLNVDFESGTSASSKTNFFTIDTVAPSVKVKAMNDIFSPNGDGNLDTLVIMQDGSKEDLWNVAIYDTLGNPVWSTFYKGEPDKKLEWDGNDSNNNLCPNGMYRYEITSTDNAGNSCKEVIENLELKNVRTPLFITIDKSAFASVSAEPDNKVYLTPLVTVKEDLLAYQLDILDENQNVLRTFSGESKVPDKFEWNGLDDDGTLVPDGQYFSRLQAIYRFGNRPTIDSDKFILDNTPPEVFVECSPKLFSPDSDGNNDDLSIYIKASDLTGIRDWQLSIMNPSNTRTFISFAGEGKPTEHIVWNGIGSNGELVDSAEDYPVKFEATDIVGNHIEKLMNPIEVDILANKLSDGRLKIRISNIEFKANSSQMTDSEKNKKILDRLALSLKKYNTYNVTIEGHANKFTRTKFNEQMARDLSKARADFIMNALIKKGISKKRLITVGKGGDEPVFVPEDTTSEMTQEELDARQEKIGKNRRVEFYLDKNN